ncbi:hypothetical protein SAMN05414139_05643 [Burkholderia sp. D7]|nr:hypothetical protein SAMN05414139_05643 [Burkholderia sp. D7]
MNTFLGAQEAADDWMGAAFADDAEGAVALRRLLHDRGLIRQCILSSALILGSPTTAEVSRNTRFGSSRCSCSILRVS